MIKIYVENPFGAQVILANTKIEKQLESAIKIYQAAINITGQTVTEHKDGSTTIHASLLKYAKTNEKTKNKIIIELSMIDEDVDKLAMMM